MKKYNLSKTLLVCTYLKLHTNTWEYLLDFITMEIHCIFNLQKQLENFTFFLLAKLVRRVFKYFSIWTENNFS